MRTYKIAVREIYEKIYDIEVEDDEDLTDACVKAEELAVDDGEITSPENMIDRSSEMIS